MSQIIEYNKDMFFTGHPVSVPEIGEVRFLSYLEYLEHSSDMGLFSLNVLHIYHLYRKSIDLDSPEEVEAIEELKSQSLISIILSQESFIKAYITIFSAVLNISDEKEKEDVIHQIFSDEELFMAFRRLVMDMQMLSEIEVSPNPEIQKGIDMSRELKSQEADATKSMDIVTSIVAGTPSSFEDVCNMTVIQVNSIFYRISAFKNYDTSVLFATVSPDVKIESWGKSINLYENETSGIKKSDFDKKYGNMF